MAIRCSNCGSSINPGQRFCCHCGQVTEEIKSNEPTQTPKPMGLAVAGTVLVLLGTLGGGIAGRTIAIQSRIGSDTGGGVAGLAIAILVLVAGMVCSSMSLSSRRGETMVMSIASLLWGAAILLTWVMGIVKGY